MARDSATLADRGSSLRQNPFRSLNEAPHVVLQAVTCLKFLPHPTSNFLQARSLRNSRPSRIGRFFLQRTSPGRTPNLTVSCHSQKQQHSDSRQKRSWIFPKARALTNLGGSHQGWGSSPIQRYKYRLGLTGRDPDGLRTDPIVLLRIDGNSRFFFPLVASLGVHTPQLSKLV